MQGRVAPERAGAYDEPALYDLLHTPGTAEELHVLERIARRTTGRAPRGLAWLEPCCGTGRFLRLLGRRGVRAVGIDLEPEVVKYANRRLEMLGFDGVSRAVRGDIRDIEQAVGVRRAGTRFDFVFCPHNSVRHLLHEADLVRHLASVRRVLAPGGVYAVGINLQPLKQPITGRDVHAAARGRFSISAVATYSEALRSARSKRLERVVTRTTVRTGDRPARVVESVYDLLCIDPAMWARCCRASGLVEVAVLDDGRGGVLSGSHTGYAYRVLGRGRGSTQRKRRTPEAAERTTRS